MDFNRALAAKKLRRPTVRSNGASGFRNAVYKALGSAQQARILSAAE
jgi:hypothetical protein